MEGDFMDLGNIANFMMMGAVPVIGPLLQYNAITGKSVQEGASDQAQSTLTAMHSTFGGSDK